MFRQYQKAYFLLSAANIVQLPQDIGREIAIVGRSNAGKSSVLNCITQHRKLARVSKTPGRTQLINVFVLDENRRLVDLPGYGYAKAPLPAKQQWEKTINAYINDRLCLKGLILVMDIRHPFKTLDNLLLEYCKQRELPVHILLNKADKLSNNQIAVALHGAKAALTEYHNSVTFQRFSASTGDGLKELYALLNLWYEYE
jgi:GTP-binding protein